MIPKDKEKSITVYRIPQFDRCLDDLRRKGGTASDAAERIDEIFRNLMHAAKSEVLPKEKKLIVYCNPGGRSYTAYRKLMKLAYLNIFQTMFADGKESGQQGEK